MRKLENALNVHQDHVSAVLVFPIMFFTIEQPHWHTYMYSLDVDYSPTGLEIVSGSYDRSIRIFPIDKGHSREVYHTKRMQR